jgi:hypothetical protein
MQGFCIGSIITTVVIGLLCLYACIYLSGTISQVEEGQEK